MWEVITIGSSGVMEMCVLSQSSSIDVKASIGQGIAQICRTSPCNNRAAESIYKTRLLIRFSSHLSFWHRIYVQCTPLSMCVSTLARGHFGHTITYRSCACKARSRPKWPASSTWWPDGLYYSRRHGGVWEGKLPNFAVCISTMYILLGMARKENRPSEWSARCRPRGSLTKAGNFLNFKSACAHYAGAPLYICIHALATFFFPPRARGKERDTYIGGKKWIYKHYHLFKNGGELHV